MSPSAQPVPRVFAVIPAAGHSRRMGRPKQLVEVAGRPLLLTTIQPLLATDVAGLVVVTRPAIADQARPALPAGIVLAYNDDEHSDMIASVRIGLRTWEARAALTPEDGILICPADQPGISTAEFTGCISAFRAAPDRIVIAARAEKRGHPLIFPAALADYVHSAACNGGLHALPRAFPQRVHLVACRSPGVTEDVDTPADLRRWTERKSD